MNLNNDTNKHSLHRNFHLDTITTQEPWFKKIEFFFNTKLEVLLGYIVVHLLDDDLNIVRIVEITTASWYDYLSKWLKDLYDNNWPDQWNFIKWKWSIFLSEVIKYININFPNRKIVTISCIEKNLPYLEPVISKVKHDVWEIIKEVTWGSEPNSFTIILK